MCRARRWSCPACLDGSKEGDEGARTEKLSVRVSGGARVEAKARARAMETTKAGESGRVQSVPRPRPHLETKVCSRPCALKLTSAWATLLRGGACFLATGAACLLLLGPTRGTARAALRGR